MRNVWTIYGLQISMEPHDVITLYMEFAVLQENWNKLKIIVVVLW